MCKASHTGTHFWAEAPAPTQCVISPSLLQGTSLTWRIELPLWCFPVSKYSIMGLRQMPECLKCPSGSGWHVLEAPKVLNNFWACSQGPGKRWQPPSRQTLSGSLLQSPGLWPENPSRAHEPVTRQSRGHLHVGKSVLRSILMAAGWTVCFRVQSMWHEPWQCKLEARPKASSVHEACCLRSVRTACGTGAGKHPNKQSLEAVAWEWVLHAKNSSQPALGHLRLSKAT